MALAAVALVSAVVVLVGVTAVPSSSGGSDRGLVVAGVVVCICAAPVASLLLIAIVELAGRTSWPTLTALAAVAATSALLATAAGLTAAQR